MANDERLEQNSVSINNVPNNRFQNYRSISNGIVNWIFGVGSIIRIGVINFVRVDDSCAKNSIIVAKLVVTNSRAPKRRDWRRKSHLAWLVSVICTPSRPYSGIAPQPWDNDLAVRDHVLISEYILLKFVFMINEKHGSTEFCKTVSTYVPAWNWFIMNERGEEYTRVINFYLHECSFTNSCTTAESI